MTTPPVSRYRQVADKLREAIVQGDYAPGERLPSTSVLAQQYGLSYPTINKAIRLLATQGLVTVVHGLGTTVRERRLVNQVASQYVAKNEQAKRAQWTTVSRSQGLAAEQRVRGVETIAPPAEIAGHLELDDDARVVARRRLLFLEGEPAQLADSYYPLAVAEGTELTQDKLLPGGTVGALERLGYVPIRFTERLSARMPTAEEERLLELSPGTPVLHHIRITYADGDRPVEAAETVMTGDRHVMIYELPAEL